ncbi:hypothetical protein H8E77_00615 [bacterium]|nr:hypothetical protein [bacterium]
MINALILADVASPPPKIPDECKVIELQTYGRKKNVRIEITALRTGLLNEIPKRLDDLISIASILYSADNRIKRGTEKDVFGDRWARNISLRIPVHDYKFWQGNIKEFLADTLRFLTEDNWDFHFEKKLSSIPVQRFLFKEKPGGLPKVTTVLPFSGGVDSLAAAIETTLSGMRPLLVSHRASPVISTRQTNLVGLLPEFCTQ